MKLLLTSAYPSHPSLDTLLAAAERSIIDTHVLCDDPSEADAILFVENTQFDDVLLKSLMNHDYMKLYADKVFMYNEMDKPWDILPGLYTCMPRKHINTERHRSFPYLYMPNEYISFIDRSVEKTWLYSFMGSMSHYCRRPIMNLKHPRGNVQDTSDFNVWNTEPDEMERRGKAYANVLAASQFVLCPRGIGSSSIRLYETLEAGCVPVIISDEWVPPPETDWSFAIQVEERRISSVPGLLQSMEGESEDRGQLARQAWSDSYAPETLFNTTGNAMESLVMGNAHQHRIRQGAVVQKWLNSGELITRSAAQRLRRAG